MDIEKIGAFIKSKRKELNLTQQELADKLMVSDRTVSKWERGVNFPDVSMYDSLCRELNITLVELLSGEDVEEKKKKDELERHLKNSIKENNKLNKISEIANLFLIGFGFVYFFINIVIMGESLVEVPNMLGYICVFIGLISFLFKSNMNVIKKWGIFILGLFIIWLVTFIFGMLFLRFNFNNNYETSPIYGAYNIKEDEVEDVVYDMITGNKRIFDYTTQIGFTISYPILTTFNDVICVDAYYKYVDNKPKLMKIDFFGNIDFDKYYNVKYEENIIEKIASSFREKQLYQIDNDISIYQIDDEYIFKNDKDIVIKKVSEVEDDKIIETAIESLKKDTVMVFDYKNEKRYREYELKK